MKKMFSWYRLERCLLLAGVVIAILYTRNTHAFTLAGWVALTIIVTVVLWILWAFLTMLRGKRH